MKVLRLDSVVFETTDLPRIRRFYVDTLGFPVGTYQKDGATIPDESETYFNLVVGKSLLGFEVGECQTGTVVLKVEDLAVARDSLRVNSAEVVRETNAFVLFRDPDGREVILEPA